MSQLVLLLAPTVVASSRRKTRTERTCKLDAMICKIDLFHASPVFSSCMSHLVVLPIVPEKISKAYSKAPHIATFEMRSSGWFNVLEGRLFQK